LAIHHSRYTASSAGPGKERKAEMTDPSLPEHHDEKRLNWRRLERVFGIPSESEREYARPERLADVMALIQVLALHHKHTSWGEWA
jgi:hypothetical protein